MEFLLNNRELQVPSFTFDPAHKCEGVFETLFPNMITRMLLHVRISQEPAVRMTWAHPTTSRKTSICSMRSCAALRGALDATAVQDWTKAASLDHGPGDDHNWIWTTIVILASGAYLANQTPPTLFHETNFNSVYQQGERMSMFVMCIDEYVLLFSP